MTVEVGQAAPDFTLKDQAGNDVSLADYKGKQPVVLVFYPFTFTGVCQGELCEIRDDPSTFESADAAVLAISCDTRHAQAQWAEQQGFTFPVLSDFWPHGAVAKELRRVQRAARVREPRQLRDRQGRQGRGDVRVREPRHAAVARRVRVGTGAGVVKFSDLLGEPEPEPERRARRPPRPSRSASSRRCPSPRRPATRSDRCYPPASEPVEPRPSPVATGTARSSTVRLADPPVAAPSPRRLDAGPRSGLAELNVRQCRSRRPHRAESSLLDQLDRSRRGRRRPAALGAPRPQVAAAQLAVDASASRSGSRRRAR